VVTRRKIGGAGLREYLPQVVVYFQDVGLKGNQRTLN
jgi:hypothetical protein